MNVEKNRCNLIFTYFSSITSLLYIIHILVKYFLLRFLISKEASDGALFQLSFTDYIEGRKFRKAEPE